MIHDSLEGAKLAARQLCYNFVKVLNPTSAKFFWLPEKHRHAFHIRLEAKQRKRDAGEHFQKRAGQGKCGTLCSSSAEEKERCAPNQAGGVAENNQHHDAIADQKRAPEGPSCRSSDVGRA
jgi:hypothetical protein